MSNPKKTSSHAQDEYNSFSDEEIELDNKKTTDKHATHKNSLARTPVCLLVFNTYFARCQGLIVARQAYA